MTKGLIRHDRALKPEPRESTLPRWVQTTLRQLREDNAALRERIDGQDRRPETRVFTHPYSDVPTPVALLGDPVHFHLGEPDENHTDPVVIVSAKRGYVEVHASSQSSRPLVVLPRNTNSIHLTVGDHR